MGRTGRLFAHEWSGVAPDIMAVAKALGGGMPIGACLATEKAAAALTAGSHGSTFGGNPLVTAVANAVLDVMLEDGFLETARATAARLRDGVEAVVAVMAMSSGRSGASVSCWASHAGCRLAKLLPP